MKNILLPLSIFFTVACSAQEFEAPQKRDNFFISTELSKVLGAASFDKKYGASLVYNRRLGNTNLGIGARVEFIDFRTKQMGGIMPGLDIRYYANFKRSTLMPLAQIGYNFYRFRYQKIGSTEMYNENGGLGYTFGIGYSYGLTTKGSGLYGAVKYRGLQYNYADPSPVKNNTSQRINLSIGWRF